MSVLQNKPVSLKNFLQFMNSEFYFYNHIYKKVASLALQK